MAVDGPERRRERLSVVSERTNRRAVWRLLVLFWLLAESWGAVRLDGILITLSLTHEILAMLVGAHRPSVTIALGRLARAGLLTRERPDRWLLTELAVNSLEEPGQLDLVRVGDAVVHARVSR